MVLRDEILNILIAGRDTVNLLFTFPWISANYHACRLLGRLLLPCIYFPRTRMWWPAWERRLWHKLDLQTGRLTIRFVVWSTFALFLTVYSIIVACFYQTSDMFALQKLWGFFLLCKLFESGIFYQSNYVLQTFQCSVRFTSYILTKYSHHDSASVNASTLPATNHLDKPIYVPPKTRYSSVFLSEFPT